MRRRCGWPWGRTPSGPRRPSTAPAFWDERNLLARRRLRAGDAAGAYALADGAAGLAPEQAIDAEFLAGFIALRRLDDTDAAAATSAPWPG